MHFKIRTVLALALAIQSANASSLFGWVFGNSTEAAAPEQSTLPVESPSPISPATNLSLPELPANVPSPKVSPRELETECEVPIEEPATQEEETELPSAESTPAGQEAGSSILSVLNPLGWFSWGSSAGTQTVSLEDSIPENTPSEVVDSTPSETIEPSGDDQSLVMEEQATPGEVAEESIEVLAEGLEKFPLRDTPTDDEELSETSADEDDKSPEEGHDDLGSSGFLDSTMLSPMVPDANFRKTLASVYDNVAAIKESPQINKPASSLEESHLVKSGEWEDGQPIPDGAAASSDSFGVFHDEFYLEEAMGQLFYLQGGDEQTSNDGASHSEPHFSDAEETPLAEDMQDVEPQPEMAMDVEGHLASEDSTESGSETGSLLLDPEEELPELIELTSSDDDDAKVQDLIVQTQQMALEDQPIALVDAEAALNVENLQSSQGAGALVEAVDEPADKEQVLVVAKPQEIDLESPPAAAQADSKNDSHPEGEDDLLQSPDRSAQGQESKPPNNKSRKNKKRRGGSKGKGKWRR